MSIIHDALKKVQHKLNVHSRNHNESLHDPRVLKKNKRYIFNFALIIFLTLISITFWYFLKQYHPPSNKQVVMASPQISPVISKPSASIEISAPQVSELKEEIVTIVHSKRSDVKVQGIVVSGNDYVALINNAIYQVGDVLDQMKIISINKDSVTLEKNGEEFTYHLGR